jgi:hypothetical protein
MPLVTGRRMKTDSASRQPSVITVPSRRSPAGRPRGRLSPFPSQYIDSRRRIGLFPSASPRCRRRASAGAHAHVLLSALSRGYGPPATRPLPSVDGRGAAPLPPGRVTVHPGGRSGRPPPAHERPGAKPPDPGQIFTATETAARTGAALKRHPCRFFYVRKNDTRTGGGSRA